MKYRKKYRLSDRLFGLYAFVTVQNALDENVYWLKWALKNVEGFHLGGTALKKYNKKLEECELQFKKSGMQKRIIGLKETEWPYYGKWVDEYTLGLIEEREEIIFPIPKPLKLKHKPFYKH